MMTTAPHALLVMDVQKSIIQSLDDPGPLLENLKKAVSTAREKDIPVIYVRVGFRKGYPEVSSNNKAFASIKKSKAVMDSSEAMEIPEEISPEIDEITLTKKRFSAFTGSDLEVILRSRHIEEITLTGISTSGVVLSTLREAADKDFKINVLSDCCADHDAEVHRVLLEKIFPTQAEVLRIGEWQKGKEQN